MRRIYVLLSNCKESTYSAEDLVVPKGRLYALLEELNYTVYEMMEQYEATEASRERAVAEQEHKMALIKEDAEKRAEDTYAASLLCARDMLMEMERISEQMCRSLRRDYDDALTRYEEKMKFFRENEESTMDQLRIMTESKKYLRLIEQQNREKAEGTAEQLTEEEKKQLEEKKRDEQEMAAAEANSELNQKLSAPIVVQVHEQPKIPEGFGKNRSKKKKNSPSASLEETSVEGEGIVERKDSGNEGGETGRTSGKDAAKSGANGTKKAEGSATSKQPEKADNGQNDGESAEVSFDPATLDNEYFDWKEEQEEGKNKKNRKKRFFGKK